MTTKYLTAFDPGYSSGVVHGTYSDTEPWELTRFWQFSNGLEGFLDWNKQWGGLPLRGACVSERFVPLSNQGFSHTAKSVEALRVEGALVALGLMPSSTDDPRWQRASMQYWVAGKNATERRRKQKAWVKENHPELYKTGKDVGAKDAEDYFSALFHSLAYMRKIEHGPTLAKYFPARGLKEGR